MNLQIHNTAVLLTFGVCLAQLAPAQTRFAEWNITDGITSVDGTLNGTGAHYRGQVASATQVGNSGTQYWTEYAGEPLPYTPVTGTLPMRTDIITLSDVGTHTVTFDAPVWNPVMLISSLGTPSVPVTYAFDRPATVLSSGYSYWNFHSGVPVGSLTQGASNSVVGREGDGAVQFNGWVSEITWTTDVAENWHGISLATVTTPAPPQTPQVLISATDLNPAGASASEGYGVDAFREAGSFWTNGYRHAALWSGSPDSVVDLHPAGVSHSRCLDLNGTLQGGYVIFPGQEQRGGTAALWSGDAQSFLNLQPPQATLGSSVDSLGGPQPVGHATLGDGVSHGVIWLSTNSPGMLTDLTPSGAYYSIARAADADSQSGYAQFGASHAALWRGSAASFVDLHPATASASAVVGASGGWQVGTGTFANHTHAALWTGTSNSFSDLHPSGATDSGANSISGTQVAGWATFDGTNTHAYLWSTTGPAGLDLHPALGTNFMSSVVNRVWTDGQTTRAVGTALQISSGLEHAILWTLRSPPTLVITGRSLSAAGTVLGLSWTGNGVAASLESADALGGVWSPISPLLTTNGSVISTTVTNNAPSQFYRLRVQ
jgi:hypothetical protein